MRRGASRKRTLALLAVAALAGGAGLLAHAAGLLGWLERPSVDARFSLRGRTRAPGDVAVVGLDNDSLAQLPRYPFTRTIHARVLERLHAAGARLVVYDISFDRPTTSTADDALFEAARTSGPVIFATTLIGPHGRTQVLGGDGNLASIGAQAAAGYLLPDGDGVIRHSIGAVRGLPSVAAAVYRALRRRAPPALVSGGWIDFPGPPPSVRTLSFASVLQGRFPASAVRGRVVVVGATAPVLQDVHSTSAGSPVSGPEAQAAAIATALAGFPLRSPPGALSALLIVALALLVPLAGVRLETAWVLVAGIAAIVLWSLAAQLAFDSGEMLDYSEPLAALAIGTAGTVLLGMRADGSERRRLRMQFAAGAGELVEQVLHAPAARPLEPTAIIAGYRLEQVVGRGGMGVVYRATQLALARPVAVKLIAAERAQDPSYRERFKSESLLASSIEHANVIPVYEAGEDDGLLFIAMRLVDGADLAQLLERSGPLDPLRTARLTLQVAGALDAAHARGLVHRDVKPANVLITVDEPEHAYLTDFGVARHSAAAARVTAAGQWVGSLDYLPPEQIRGEQVDARADVYALACVLYHCLAGQPPFARESASATLFAHVATPPPAPTRAVRTLPAEIDAVIARGMAKDPARRFASAGELAHACASALGIAVEAPGDAHAHRSAQPRSHAAGPRGDAPTLLSE